MSKHAAKKERIVLSALAKPLLSLVGSKILEEKFFHAAYTGNIPQLNKCIQKGVNPNALVAEDGQTVLHLIAMRDDVEVGSVLMKCPKTDLNWRSTDGFAPLHICCLYNSLKFANVLLQHGANPNMLNRQGKTCLHLAVEGENYGLVMKLLKYNADVNILDCFLNTPLAISIVHVNNYLIARTLLLNGANMNEEHKRPLHIFFETVLNCHTINQIDFVILLLDNGIDVNMKEEGSERNCLHFVAITGYLDLAIVLVEKGADWTAVDGRNRTPAKAATEHGNDIVADYFRKGYRPPRLLKTLPLLHLWSNKLKARITQRRVELEAEQK